MLLLTKTKILTRTRLSTHSTLLKKKKNKNNLYVCHLSYIVQRAKTGSPHLTHPEGAAVISTLFTSAPNRCCVRRNKQQTHMDYTDNHVNYNTMI